MANYTSKKDLVVGKRFKKIIENLFPNKSRQYVADAIGVLNEARIRLYENGSIPEPAVLSYLDRQGYSIEWLLINKGAMTRNDREGPVFVDESQPTVAELPPTEKARATPVDDLPESNTIQWTAPYGPRNVPVVGEAAADESEGSRSGIFPSDAMQIWDNITVPDNIHMIKIRGNSMSPLILDGQYAVIDEFPYSGRVQPPDRSVVVAEIAIHDEEQAGSDARWEGVYCKRVVDGGDVWWFLSVNMVGKPFSVAKSNCRLWPVLGIWFAGKGVPPEED